MTTPPETLMLLSKVSKGDPVAVALLFNVAVQTPPLIVADTTIVFAGIPVPDTETPGPIAIIVVENVTVGEPFVVDPVAVNTPTGLTVDPVNVPIKGLVFTVLSMYCKFWPGWAIRLLLPVPLGSNPESNCHNVFEFGAYVDNPLIIPVNPEPVPPMLDANNVTDC